MVNKGLLKNINDINIFLHLFYSTIEITTPFSELDKFNKDHYKNCFKKVTDKLVCVVLSWGNEP